METIPRSDRIKKKRKRNTSNAFLEQCYDKKKPISVIKITSTTTIDKSVSSIFNNNKNNINEKKFPKEIITTVKSPSTSKSYSSPTLTKKKVYHKQKIIRVNPLTTRRAGCDFLQRHVAEVDMLHRNAENPSEHGHFMDAEINKVKYPCTCKELAKIVNIGSGRRVCTMCGLVLENNMVNEYTHMRGSAEGNNPDTGEKRSAAARNTSGIANHYFLRNSMIGTQNVKFINSRGKYVHVKLPEDKLDKCYICLTVALRDNVFLLKLSQRIYDTSLSVLEDLEREHFFQDISIPFEDEIKLLPLLLGLLYIACKIVGHSRSLRELCNPFPPEQITPSIINNWLKKVKTYLTIKIPITKPIEYISRFCHLNGVKEHEERIAREICIEASNVNIDANGRLAQEIALASIFLAIACVRSDLPDIEDMARNVGVSKNAVEKSYMKLRQYSYLLLPKFVQKLLDVKVNALKVQQGTDNRSTTTIEKFGSVRGLNSLPTFRT